MHIVKFLIFGLLMIAVGAGAGGWAMSRRAAASSEVHAATTTANSAAMQARLEALENDLATARNTIGTLEKQLADAVSETTATETASATTESGPTDINTIFQQAKPLLQSLGPLFDNARRQGTKAMADRRVAEFAEKYRLTSEQQDAIKKWFEEKSDQDAAKGREMLNKPDANLQDLIAAGRGQRPDDGLEDLMAATLDPEQLSAYQADRLQERASNVESEATRRVNRLNDVVQLDDSQQDKVFAIMARSSSDYDPAMRLEGLGSDVGPLSDGTSRDEAILAVLRPDQRAAYEADRQRRRDEAAKNLEAVGIKADLDAFESLGR